MKVEYLIKIILPTFIVFAVLVWLTVAHLIAGWLMYFLWILGFVGTNIWVTKVTAKRSYHRLKKQREEGAQQRKDE